MTGNKPFHIIADWDVRGSAVTKETYPIYDLHEKSFDRARRAAEDAGFTIRLNY